MTNQNYNSLKPWMKLPPAARGHVIGLYGGTFDPAHDGHRQVSLAALRRLNLDQIWWLVTPGNPLKSNNDLPPIERRISKAKSIAKDGRIIVSGAEAGFNAIYSAETIRKIKTLRPGTRFIWIMGADNLAQINKWKNWRQIFRTVPVLVIARPGHQAGALASVAAKYYSNQRVAFSDIDRLASKKPPVWCYLHLPRISLSSTMLRTN